MSEMVHRWIIDRFEGDLAVVEVDGGRFLDLPRWLLPTGAATDDVLVVEGRSNGEDAVSWQIRVDAEATARAREEARQIVARLRAKDPGGDLTL